MSQRHILTVGISLLTNFARTRNLSPDAAAKHHKEIAEFLHAEPRKACAELNSLGSRTRFLDEKTPGLSVTLAFTTTQKGKLCASLIERELKRRKVFVHRLPLKGVDAPSQDLTPEYAAQKCAESLTKLRERVADHITRMKRADPVPKIELNCTGGCKSECAVLYELGRALRVPVYYHTKPFRSPWSCLRSGGFDQQVPRRKYSLSPLNGKASLTTRKENDRSTVFCRNYW